MLKKKFRNPETDRIEEFREEWLQEKVTVKEINDLFVVNHYWRDSEGELWVDFENPNENIVRAFAMYRKRKGFMKPSEIRDLRIKLGVTDREFASFLGISDSTLSEIEHNKRVQLNYQEKLFRYAEQRYLNLENLSDVNHP